MAVLLAFVILPFVSTVIVGILVDEPYVFGATPVFVKVPTPVTFPVPLKLGLV
jgi:hypothetical protein